MSTSRELVAFVHGMGIKEPEEYLNRLVAGIQGYCDSHGLGVRVVEDHDLTDQGVRHVSVTLPDGSVREFDVQEVYWGDLRPVLSSASTVMKILRGIDLFGFWIRSGRMWRAAFRSSKYMQFSMLASLGLVLMWYYGAIVAALTAVGANPGSALPPVVADRFADWGAYLGGWYVWGVAAAILAFLPGREVIDIGYATKCYLQNRRGMFHKVCGRLGKVLGQMESAGYDAYTVVAHSFGVIVATEALAKRPVDRGPDVRLVTLGGPLELITARSDRVRRSFATLIRHPSVSRWVDFYSHDDWLCTRSPVPEETVHFESRRISSTVAIDEKVTGESHGLYFSDWAVMEELVRGMKPATREESQEATG